MTVPLLYLLYIFVIIQVDGAQKDMILSKPVTKNTKAINETYANRNSVTDTNESDETGESGESRESGDEHDPRAPSACNLQSPSTACENGGVSCCNGWRDGNANVGVPVTVLKAACTCRPLFGSTCLLSFPQEAC